MAVFCQKQADFRKPSPNHGLFLKQPFRGVSTAKERRVRRLHRRRIPAPRAETRVIGHFATTLRMADSPGCPLARETTCCGDYAFMGGPVIRRIVLSACVCRYSMVSGRD